MKRSPQYRSLCFVALLSGLLLSPFGSSLLAQHLDTPVDEVQPGKNGAEPFVPLLYYVEDSDTRSLDSVDLDQPSGTLIDSLGHGTVGLNYCNDLSIHSGSFRVSLDLGEDYNYGDTAFTVDLSLKIEGVDKSSGETILITHNPVSLSIDQDAPEQVFFIQYTGTDLTNHELVDVYRIYVNSFSVTGIVGSDVRVTVRFDDEYAVDALRTSPNESEPIIYQDPVGGSLQTTVVDNPVEFEWHNALGCSDQFPSYQLQVLRLFNTETSYNDDAEQVKATVNWNHALTFETGNPESIASLTLPQGTGWYLWRVRPVGSQHSGGSADSRNWGVWTRAPADGVVIDYDGLLDQDVDTFAFFYQQFEDTLNWVYSRGFTEGEEGTRVAEGMTFFTPQGQARQTQTYVAEDGAYVAYQKFYDYQGRPAAISLAAPFGSPGFAYKRDFAVKGGAPYSAQHFDSDAKHNDPDQLDNGSLNHYYSGNYSPAPIPSADGYPISRLLYTNDGTERMDELGGLGSTYRIGGGSGGQSRETKIYYASASEEELIRLFGDEAPYDTTVSKVLVSSPNKVTAVQYVSEGRVIASALQVAQGDTLLLDLDSPDEPRLTEDIVDTLKGNRSRGRRGLSAHKRYAFTDSTDITLTYKLTPETITTSGVCIDTCVTCDYRIRLYIHDVHQADSTQVFEHNLGADPCAEALSIDTSFTLTLPPGTYIIERRLEIGTIDPNTIDSLHPYGKTYSEQFREVVAGAIRDSVLADDSITVVMNYLSSNDLAGLYEYLGLDLDSLQNYQAVTLYTECCEVTFPILDPDCGFNPCRDSTPDFEDYLFDQWGSTYGTELNNYFKFDGDQGRWSTANRPQNPFNTLITNMLADTNASGEYLYDCETLWSIWTGIVDAFESLRDDPDDPGSFNPDFDMLSQFLHQAGVYWIDTSHTPYNTTNGYLLWAHRYVDKKVLDEQDCKTRTGYNTGWHNDIDSTERWKEIYGCWEGENRDNSRLKDQEFGGPCDLSHIYDGIGGNPLWPDDFTQDERNDSCMVYTAIRVENECRSICEDRRIEFAYQIIETYADSGITISIGDALCQAEALVDSCRSDCDLTIYGSDPIDSVGSTSEWVAIARVRLDRVEMSIPLDTNGVKYCANDTMALFEGREIAYEDIIMDHLNMKLAERRRTHGGQFWDGFMDVLRQVAPDSIVNRMSDSVVFVPPWNLDVPAYFELRNGCELWYVSDTIFWNQLPTSQPHPLVEALNQYLDNSWGIPIDSIQYDEPLFWLPYKNSNDSLVSFLDNPASSVQSLDQIVDAQPVIFLEGSIKAQVASDIIQVSRFAPTKIFPSVNKASGYIVANYEIRSSPSTDVLDLFTGMGGFVSTGEEYLHFVHRLQAPCSDTSRLLVGSCDVNDPGFVDVSHTYVDVSCDDIPPFNTLLSQPHTALIGKFIEEDDGWLAYVSYQWNAPDSIPDTCRLFDLRMYGLPTAKLSDSICGIKTCPDICWRWVDRPAPDWSDVDTLRPPPCEETVARRINGAINRSINACIDAALIDLKQEYDTQCTNLDSLNEEITVGYPVDYIHFSLFYYDRAGRLVRTVPPKGVDILPTGASRATDSPNHTHITEYDYNSLGQVVRTKSPDAGESQFWYDTFGRLRFSQDARKAARGEYSYTKYDELGRSVEVGVSTERVDSNDFFESLYIDDPNFPSTGSERTYIAYDTATSVDYLDGSPQTFLRNRVSRSWNDQGVETHYSYDVHGNTEWVAQIVPDFPKTNYVKYEYDLISGNVNNVLYNEGRVDQFHHRYSYDRDNALTEVETSRDGVIWDSDARYDFYAHGPIRRVEIGEDKVQGLDLTYTLQGKLKGINHTSLQDVNDPGDDGVTTGNNAAFAADSFAITLHYHEDDYYNFSSPHNSGGDDDLVGVPLYDGGISGVEINVGKKTGTGQYEERTGTTYRYDQLGRLDSSRFHTYNTSTDAWNDFVQEYLTTYDYDPSGNITTLERHAYDRGSGATDMDSLTYNYYGGENNKLNYVADAVAGMPYNSDIEDTQSDSNYVYDEVGNLIQDFDEGTMATEWDAYGKVLSVDRSFAGGLFQEIEYTYDPGGNRVKKKVETTGVGTWEERETFYMYDAGGVVVAIYEKVCEATSVSPPGGGPDTDGDGWPDGIDNCPLTPNPNQRDSDGDGWGDSCDICICVPDPAQLDSDMDGIGDSCDVAPGNPIVPPFPNTDADGDGWADDHDNCPCTYNPNQEDSDFDGYGDSCDVCDYRLVELPIYGNGRVGVVRPDISIFDSPNLGPTYTRYLDQKHYELTDHLGNVRVVLGDRKLTSTPGAGNYYADIQSYSHPYPFGMPQPGRNWLGSSSLNRGALGGYRYGFNGMETDPEVKGIAGNHYTTYFRQYDPRLGRWWSVDPVTHPWESPYVAMHNNPIFFSDPRGDDPPDCEDCQIVDPRTYDSDSYKYGPTYEDSDGNRYAKRTHLSTNTVDYIDVVVLTKTRSPNAPTKSIFEKIGVLIDPFASIIDPVKDWAVDRAEDVGREVFGDEVVDGAKWIYRVYKGAKNRGGQYIALSDVLGTQLITRMLASGNPLENFKSAMALIEDKTEELKQFIHLVELTYNALNGDAEAQKQLKEMPGVAWEGMKNMEPEVLGAFLIDLAASIGGAKAAPGAIKGLFKRGGKSTGKAATETTEEIVESAVEETVEQGGKEGATTTFSRALTADDLGIQGTVTQMKGSISVMDEIATVKIDIIDGLIENPFELIGNLERLALRNGAKQLRIEGTLANDRLLNILSRRYNMRTEGGGEILIRDLK